MGRPREFDTDKVLGEAMRLFWKKGYEGTSMRDLLAATGLNKQSLYGAFGNKQQLYLAAFRNYEDAHVQPAAELLRGPGSARVRTGKLLQLAIDQVGKGSNRHGCLMCNAAVDREALDAETRAEVMRCVEKFERMIAAALSETPPYDQDSGLRLKRARALLAAYFGLHVLAKSGASKSALEDVRNAALDSI